MILSKTPLRIPLAGGLTDLKPYAQQFGGVTVSCTIDKYVYVALKENLEGNFDLRYQDAHEKVREASQIKNDLIRESLKLSGLEHIPLQIVIMVDLSSESGLGSSGACTVGLLHAMHAFKGESVSQRQLLEEAAHIEVDILEGASGYHDPTICALGGLKLIEYRRGGISTRDVSPDPEVMRAFAGSLLFFYSGRHARTKPSLDLLISHLPEAYDLLHRIRHLGYELEKAFTAGNLQRIAEIIGEQQALKQQLPGKFVDDFVRDVTERARQAGAFAQFPGGKISAFVIVCCPSGEHHAVREALADLEEVRLGLEMAGTQVTEI